MQPSHHTNFLFVGGEDLNMFCGHFWAETCGDVFSARISEFCTAIEARLLPAFDDLEGEADQAANAEWDRLSREADPEWVDQAEVAERATEVGVAYYLSMQSVRQALINLSIAALYHLFEQQMLFFHRQQLLHPREENDASLINMRELMSRLALGGVDVHKMRSWPRIQELKAAANVVKHAEGRSADELRQMAGLVWTPGPGS